MSRPAAHIGWDAKWPPNPAQTYANELAENIVVSVLQQGGKAFNIDKSRLVAYAEAFLRSQWASFSDFQSDLGWIDDIRDLVVPMFKLWFLGYSVSARGPHWKECGNGRVWNPISLVCLQELPNN